MPAKPLPPTSNMGENRQVFINCPFDRRYAPLFEAIVFSVFDCGFVARSALEYSDSSEPRIEKIVTLIGRCRYSIHDLSRTELDKRTGLPRFNMPLELGICLGAQRLGTRVQRNKRCLILDRERYRYQKFISDISGQDILAHGAKPRLAAKCVRDWLSDQRTEQATPGANAIWNRYVEFRRMLPLYCEAVRQSADELTFNDYTRIVAEWLRDYPR